jgi:hypothetical protein
MDVVGMIMGDKDRVNCGCCGPEQLEAKFGWGIDENVATGKA